MATKHINTLIKSVDGPPGGGTDSERASGTKAGTFTGYASVFGNVDSYGDVVVKGAFADSLKSQDSFPVYWSHQMSNPMMNIGKTTEIYEDDHGLFVKAELDLDTEMGAQVYRLIKDGRVNQMSFAFDVEDYAVAHDDERGDYFELRKLKLHEVSVVQVGANQETELLDVKDRVSRVKAGRAISKANGEKLSEAVRLISEVLDASDGDGDSEESSDEKSGDTETRETEPDIQPRSYDPDAALAQLYITISEGES